MEKLVFNAEFFNIKDTLECGQIFRYRPFEKGYIVISANKICYAYNEGENAILECEKDDCNYFINFFDIDRKYDLIYNSALNENIEFLTQSAVVGKGVRILNQDKRETLISFMISQNNNIPRIKLILERLCEILGEEKLFLGEKYYTFPTIEKMALAPLEFYEQIGLGYRAKFIKRIALDFADGFDLNSFDSLSTLDAKKELVKLYGVGAKVADCVLLFGLHKSDSFPVDTWIEKIYKDNFNGQLTNRDKISDYFVGRFKENSGYFQQYMFYYKRLNQKNEKTKQKHEKNN